MAAQAAPVAGNHQGRRRPAAARGALHLQAVGINREDHRGPGRPPRCLQGNIILHTPWSQLSDVCCCTTPCIYEGGSNLERTQMTGLSCRGGPAILCCHKAFLVQEAPFLQLSWCLCTLTLGLSTAGGVRGAAAPELQHLHGRARHSRQRGDVSVQALPLPGAPGAYHRHQSHGQAAPADRVRHGRLAARQGCRARGLRQAAGGGAGQPRAAQAACPNCSVSCRYLHLAFFGSHK